MFRFYLSSVQSNVATFPSFCEGQNYPLAQSPVAKVCPTNRPILVSRSYKRFLDHGRGKDELLNPDPLKENEFALCGLEIN